MAEVPVRVPEQPTIAPPEHGPAGPERHLETSRPSEAERVKPESTVAPPSVVTPIQTATQPTATTPELIENVETILSEGLEDAYRMMDPAMQTQFKQAGEVTARSITSMLQSTKIQAKKIIELIFNWLKIIPGINRFFIEQEAKIKADRILSLSQTSNVP